MHVPKMALSTILVIVAGCATMRIEWQAARTENTVAAYDEFTTRFPQGPLADSARLLARQCLFDSISQVGTRAAYEAFLDRYATGRLADSARWMVRNYAFAERAESGDSISAYIEYVRSYPSGGLAVRFYDRLRAICQRETAELTQRPTRTRTPAERFLAAVDTGFAGRFRKARALFLRIVSDYRDNFEATRLAEVCSLALAGRVRHDAATSLFYGVRMFTRSELDADLTGKDALDASSWGLGFAAAPFVRQMAASELENSIRLDSSCSAAYYYLGLVRARQGSLAAAVTALERSLELGSDDYGICHSLALVYARQRRYDNAVEYISRARNLLH